MDPQRFSEFLKEQQDGTLSAEAFADKMHEGLPYGPHPYRYHLERVVAILARHGQSETMRVAGWLHDVVEDTPTTSEEVETLFGSEVARLVWAVTGVGPTRPDRNQDAYRKIVQTRTEHPGLDPTTLKLADRVANVMESIFTGNTKQLAKYQREMEGFRQALQGAGLPALWLELEGLLKG